MLLRPALTGLLATVPAIALAAFAVPAQAEPTPRPVLAGNFADPAVAVHGDGFVRVLDRQPGAAVVRRRAGRCPARGRLRAGPPAVPGRTTTATSGPRTSRGSGSGGCSTSRPRSAGWASTAAASASPAPARPRPASSRSAAVPRSARHMPGHQPSTCRPPRTLVPIAVAGLPRAGVIDPSLVIAGGRPHLLYKTDRIPSSIRLLPLSRSGLHAAGTSVELFRHDGVLENPVLIERPAGWVMLLSQGDFTRCSYRTVWRRSTSILNWVGATTGVLLDQSSRLCGPGGADVTPMPHSRRLRIFFHAWTCHGRTAPCGPEIHRDKLRHRARAVRPMYAADLDWVDGVPVIAGFL
ncbi:hypothetical protein [Nocardioides sp. B-3]|uniref:hypothetical protein n=1 Tax=Nocardioides sp. B-3 TaxID=2895565 RepID=UPI0021537B1B|nr:hypothetical protein [Nocardioides sp. B-3]UUZ61297.1 hypothetical protein LP418_12305 [Nocardioides sp. B-3]